MKMRIAILSSIAILFLLVEVQGVHVKHGILSAGHEEKKNSESPETKASEESVECKDGDSFSGRSRKLLTDTTFTTSAIPTTKIVNSEGTNSKRQSTNKRLNGIKTKPQDIAPKRYPDLIDIAGMDYATAKRKAPIHN